jgi:excisionase family DNA binding protein
MKLAIEPTIHVRALSERGDGKSDVFARLVDGHDLAALLPVSPPRYTPPKPRELAAADRELTYDVPEVARLLGISRSSAYKAVNTGEIPCIHIGSRILVPRVAVERLLQSGAPNSPPPPAC